MLIGVPKEVKNHEYRVGLTPSSVHELIKNGHRVLIEHNAGYEIDFDDAEYQAVGAEVCDSAAEIFAKADMIVKVKEPQVHECKMLRPNQVIFTFLHLAPDPIQTNLLMQSGCIAIAYETVTDECGHLPLLAPMSEVAGRMAIQAGAHCLEKSQGGRGVLLGGVVGVSPARVLVLGGGVVGANSIEIALGMGAQVTVIDKSLNRLRELWSQFGVGLNTIYSNSHNIEKYARNSDLIIGAVLVPGAKAPKLVSKELVASLARGTVLVDVAIDQGGCFETSRPTTHAEPTYIVDGVVHYCVTNMPGGCARTSTIALNNATLPYVIELANKGYRKALLENKHLMNGLNVGHGQVTHTEVASAVSKPYVEPKEVLL